VSPFLGYRSSVRPEDVALRGRAKRVLERVMAAAVDAKQKAEPILRSGGVSDADKAPMEALYVAGDRLLDHACSQFYFGSGAFRQSAEESPGVAAHSEKRVFLEDYRELLDQIGRHGSAQTIHNLIQLYVFLSRRRLPTFSIISLPSLPGRRLQRTTSSRRWVPRSWSRLFGCISPTIAQSSKIPRDAPNLLPSLRPSHPRVGRMPLGCSMNCRTSCVERRSDDRGFSQDAA
jgi:hypothetical protein